MKRLTPEQPLHRCLTAFLVVLSLVPSPLLHSNPTGEIVLHGDVQFDRSAGQLRVLQASDRAIIDWESFSIAEGQVTEFVQPNSNSGALNRVRGASASQIEGMLRANGKVYLLNPNGILIGPDGSIDVGGFAGSTLDVSDEQFRNGGDLNFAGASQAAIVNLGSISALDGDVILIAASVSNEGTIKAPNGTAALAAGNDVLLAESGSERVFVRGASGGNKAVGVNNSGAIEANIAELKSYGGNIYGMAVRNEGRVAATGVTRQGGQIFLSAKGGRVRSTGTLKARNSDGSGGSVKVDSGADGRTEIGGKIDASGDSGKGGEIVILGREIEVFEGSLILNDGETGGGNTFVGGGLRGQDPDFINAENVTVGVGSLTSANAQSSGNGGQVVFFAEDTLEFGGEVSVRGGIASGDGGFVELSGKKLVRIPSLSRQVHLSAPNGRGGTLLLDPTNVIIKAGAAPPIAIASADTILYADDIATSLGSGNIVVATDNLGIAAGDITVEKDASISWNSGNSLTLQAHRDITLVGDGTIGATISSTGSGAFSATAARAIILGNKSSIKTANGSLTLGANLAGTTTGNFSGITVGSGSLVESTGSGTINLTGKGGVALTGDDLRGVEVSGTIRSASGAIEISGTGGGGTTGQRHNGIRIESTGLIESTGNGSVAATITLTGIGGSGSGDEQGIAILGDISSIDGDISLTGTGGASANGNNKGIHLFGTGSITSTGTGVYAANVVLTGYGSNSQAGLFSDGIGLPGGSITSAEGNITLTGTSYLGDNVGIRMGTPTTTTTVASSGSGKITITAIGSPAANLEDFFTQGTGPSVVSSIGSATGTGGITVNADTMNLAFATLRNSGALILQSVTTGTTIGLGGGSGTLNLTDTELSRLAAGFTSITIGDATTGAVDIDSATFNDHLSIIGSSIAVEGLASSGKTVTLTALSGAITDGGGTTDVTASNLALFSATGVGTSSDALETAVSNLEADGGSGGIFIDNTGDVTIGGVSGSLDGLAATNAKIDVSAASAITITEDINSGGGDVILSATQGIAVQANVIAGAGAIEFTADSDGLNSDGAFGISAAGSVGGATQSGNITVKADTLDLGGSVEGTGELNLLPRSYGTTIGIGDMADGDLNLDATEIGQLQNGFSLITIGNSNAGNIDVRAATFQDPLSIYGSNNITVNGLLTGEDDASITLQTVSSATTYLNANIVTDGEEINIIDSVVLGADVTLDTTGGGNIAFADGANVTIDYSVDGSGMAPFDFTINAGYTGLIDLQDNVGADDLIRDIDFKSAGLTLGGTLKSTGGDISFLTDAISLAGNVSGTGTLKIGPQDYQTSVGIGDDASGSLHLNSDEIGRLQNGFSSITIGNSYAGDIDVQAATFQDPLSIYGSNNIYVNGQLTGSGDASIALETISLSTTYLNADIVTDGNAINIIDSVVLGANVTLDTTGGGSFGSGANITIDQTVDGSVGGPQDLTVTAGTAGTITVNGAIGGGGMGDDGPPEEFFFSSFFSSVSNPVGNISLSGANLVLGAGINATGDISLLADSLSLGGSLSSPGGLTIAPLSSGNSMLIGDPDEGAENGEDVLHLNSSLLSLLSGGFSSISFGGASTSSITLEVSTFQDPMKFTASSFYVNGTLTGEDDASLEFFHSGGGVPSTTHLAADLITNGNAILIDDSVVLSNNVTLDTTGGGTFSDGANVTINYGVDGDDPARNFTITAGSTGDVSLMEIGADGFIEELTLDGREITLGGAVKAQSDVTVSGSTINVDGTIETSGGLTFNINDFGTTDSGTIYINSALTAGGGLAFNGGDGTVDKVTYAGFSGPVEFALDDLSAIEILVGSAHAGDILNGPALGSDFDFDDADSFSVSGIAVSAFENVTGGVGNDVFSVGENSSLSGALDGGGGTSNELNYATFGSGVSVDFDAGTATAINGGFSGLAKFVGSGETTDSFTGTLIANTYTITGENDYEFEVGSDTILVSDFANLTGGSGDDTFTFQAAGSLTGNLVGGGTANELNLAALATPVGVNFQTSKATGIGGTFSGINEFVGNGAGFTFTGSETGTPYSITGINNFSFGLPLITVTNFANLTGGSDIDTFNFGSGSSLSGTLDGGAGSDNEIDYRTFGATVSVNVANSSATAIKGGAANGFSNITKFVGSGETNDSFQGTNGTSTYNLVGTNAFNDGTFSAFGIENLTGGSANDTFIFAAAATLTGNLVGGDGTNRFAFDAGSSLGGTLDGGAGSDNEIDYSTFGATVSVNVADSSATAIKGGAANGFSNITKFVGSAETNDSFQGTNATRTYNLTGANAFNDGTFFATGIENLTGGSAKDTFIFADAATLTGNLVGGGTENQLDLSAYTTAVGVNFQSSTSTGIGGTFSDINDFVGNGTNFTFTGSNLAKTYNFTGTNTFAFDSVNVTGFANLTGGTGLDTFVFANAAALNGNLVGGGTENQLDLSAYLTTVGVNFDDSTSTGIGGTFSDIDDFVGNGTNFTFTGSNLAKTYNFTGTNTFAFDSVNVTGFANLTGGTGLDTFVFANAAALNGNLVGGGTENQLDLSAFLTTVGVNFHDSTSTGIGGTFSDINDFVGNGANFTFTGSNLAKTYNFTGTNTFGFDSVSVTGFANLTGGTGLDTFVFANAATLTGNLVGGGIENQLDLSAYLTTVGVNFQAATATGIGGTFSGIDDFVGNGANSTFTGSDDPLEYLITDQNDFEFVVGTDTYTVTDFANLTGGTGDDTFSFGIGSSLSGTIDGGVGLANELNYSTFGTTVSVNVENSSATAIKGGAANGFSNITKFVGSGETNDSFQGTNGTRTYNLTGANAFNDGTFYATGIENLTAGSSNDVFQVASTGSLAGILAGAGGTDTLTYSTRVSAVTVNLGSEAATDLGGFSGVEDFVGSSSNDTLEGTDGNDVFEITSDNSGTVNADITFASFETLDAGDGDDFFNFRNQATVAQLVDGGAGDYDTLFLDDSTLPGVGVEHTYTITSNSITRNPVYTFFNIEHLNLVAGAGDDTINSNFFDFSQSLDSGLGFNTLNLPGVSNLDGADQIQNVSHLRFAAPRTLTSNPGDGNTPPPPAEFVAQNRFNNGTSDQMMQQLMGNQGGFGATTVIGQGVIIAVEGNSYLIFRAISLDGSGLNPSDAASAALSDNLSVDANVELAGAIGYTGIVLLFMRDGAYAIDLSGAAVNPAVLGLLQSNLGTAAAIELFAALEMPFVINIIDADGAITIDFDGNAPGQVVILLLAEQLSDAAFDELNAALAAGN